MTTGAMPLARSWAEIGGTGQLPGAALRKICSGISACPGPPPLKFVPTVASGVAVAGWPRARPASATVVAGSAGADQRHQAQADQRQQLQTRRAHGGQPSAWKCEGRDESGGRIERCREWIGSASIINCGRTARGPVKFGRKSVAIGTRRAQSSRTSRRHCLASFSVARRCCETRTEAG